MHRLPVESWAEWDSGLSKVNGRTLTVFTGILILGGMVNILTCFPHKQGTLALWVFKRLIQTPVETVVYLVLISVGFGHSLIGGQLACRVNS